MHVPPPLAPGARVTLLAPSGPLASDDEIGVALANAKSFGWNATVGEHVLARRGYLAGTDRERASDLNAALRDATNDGVWCLRGGYGAMRLLETIDVDAMRNRPRVLIGYSDITALHTTFSRAGIVTFHGPTARSALSSFSRDSLERAVVKHADSCGDAPNARTLRKGKARGRLVGGNLALLASLAGTRFAPDYTNGILVVEDVGEATYKIDRMLRQLALSGALSNLAGIAFGEFTDGTDPEETTSIPLSDVLQEIADIASVPAISGIPLGHIADQWTIPLGAMAELDADVPALHVKF